MSRHRKHDRLLVCVEVLVVRFRLLRHLLLQELVPEAHVESDEEGVLREEAIYLAKQVVAELREPKVELTVFVTTSKKSPKSSNFQLQTARHQLYEPI